jgi:hypothetical protein
VLSAIVTATLYTVCVGYDTMYESTHDPNILRYASRTRLDAHLAVEEGRRAEASSQQRDDTPKQNQKEAPQRLKRTRRRGVSVCNIGPKITPLASLRQRAR